MGDEGDDRDGSEVDGDGDSDREVDGDGDGDVDGDGGDDGRVGGRQDGTWYSGSMHGATTRCRMKGACG